MGNELRMDVEKLKTEGFASVWVKFYEKINGRWKITEDGHGNLEWLVTLIRQKLIDMEVKKRDE